MKRELPEGYTVDYVHRHGVGRRRPARLEPTPISFLSTERYHQIAGGHSTEAVVCTSGGVIVSIGVAMCRPEDQFSKRLGRIIALGRALKALEAMCPLDTPS